MENKTPLDWENEERENKKIEDKRKEDIFPRIRAFNSSPRMILIYGILSILIVIYYTSKLLKEGVGDGFGVTMLAFGIVYLLSLLIPKIFPNNNILAKRGRLLHGIVLFLLLIAIEGGLWARQKGWFSEIPFLQTIKNQNETADWQTYRNEEYGFEIKYPSAFTSISTGPNFVQEALNKGEQISGTVPPAFDVIVFHDKDGDQFSIEIYRQLFNNLDQNYVYGGECGSQFADENILNQIVNMNGTDFLKRSQVMTDNKIRIDYCFLSGTNNLVALRAENIGPAEADKISNLFNQMLSTFKFLK